MRARRLTRERPLTLPAGPVEGAPSGGERQGEGARVALRRWLARESLGVLLAEWTLCNVGQWAVVSVLSLYLLVTLHLAPGPAAALLMFASFSFRLTRFFVAPVLDRLQPRTALMLSLGAAALGYVALAVFPPAALLLLPVLPLVGAGYGSNALLVKSMVAGGERGRLVRYAAVSAGMNAGSALGPLLGVWLFLHVGANSAFAMAAACFAGAGLITFWLPRRPAAGAASHVSWLDSLRSCLGIAGFRRALLFIGLLFFLYSQLYATLPLAATQLLGTPDLLGPFFALNAVLVICAQIPISRLISAASIPPGRLVKLGYATYAISFLFFWLWPNWGVAFAAMVGWSLAEMLLLPGIDAMTASALPPRLRISGFSLGSVAMALGEGSGAFVGVAVAGQLALNHQLRAWYGALFGCAVAAVVIAVVVGGGTRAVRRSERPGAAERPSG